MHNITYMSDITAAGIYVGNERTAMSVFVCNEADLLHSTSVKVETEGSQAHPE